MQNAFDKRKEELQEFNEALEQWYDSYRGFNQRVYNVIKYILKHSKCRTLLNRNPTINFGSFMCMEIAHVKKDYNDLSCGLPIACLQALNADFDGDIVNHILLLTDEMKKSFGRVLSPKNTFLLSKNDGKLNEDFALIKDQAIAFYEFCTC